MWVMGDDIKFTLVATPVPVQHLPAKTHEMLNGPLLPDLTDGTGFSTNNHKITSCPHSGQEVRFNERFPQGQFWSGTEKSEWAISSMETSRKVRTFALLTKRAGRYMSHTQASPMETS